MPISEVLYRKLPSPKRKELRALWSLAFRTQKDTFMDGWLNKTPRQEPATKHVRRARWKAAEEAYKAAYPVLKSRPLSGLHTIPKKASKGAPLVCKPVPQNAKRRKTKTPGRITTGTGKTRTGNEAP